MAILWNKYDNIDYEDEEGMKRKKLIDDALDWIYLGKMMRDQRNTLMAYVTALEILIDQGKDSPTLKTILSEEEYANLGKQIDDVLKVCIQDKQRRGDIKSRDGCRHMQKAGLLVGKRRLKIQECM